MSCQFTLPCNTVQISYCDFVCVWVDGFSMLICLILSMIICLGIISVLKQLNKPVYVQLFGLITLHWQFNVCELLMPSICLHNLLLAPSDSHTWGGSEFCCLKLTMTPEFLKVHPRLELNSKKYDVIDLGWNLLCLNLNNFPLVQYPAYRSVFFVI